MDFRSDAGNANVRLRRPIARDMALRFDGSAIGVSINGRRIDSQRNYELEIS